MAEETGNTKKPKAQLIKHSQSEEVPAASAKNTAEQGERRKVKVVMKKPSSLPAKKNQPKVVVSAGSSAASTGGSAASAGSSAASAGSSAAKAGSSAAKAGTSAVPSGKTVHAKKTEGAFKKDQDKRPALTTKFPAKDTGADPHRVSSFPMAQRPAAAAGRVGGKLVGGNQGGHPAQRSGRAPVRSNKGFGDSPPGRSGIGQRPAGPGLKPGFAPKPGAGKPGGFNRAPGARPGTAPPESLPEGKGPAKRKFIAKRPVYNRKEKEQEMEEKLLQTKKKITHVANPVPKSIDIMEVISVSELARKMNLKASDLIQKLMSMGQMVTINQQIDADTATILAAEFGADVRIISLYDETVIETISDDEALMLPRPPVVTVMGHVDHGKTKLLDAIRKADVVAGEFGGITQHIGAYMVETAHGSITFLDTPGHEAFTRMRARGAQITDIVVLVVAADDGVMPQTVEAINHAKDAKVPIIVAVNKIDKPEANPDKVKSQLSDLGLMPEDWGGQTMFVELSALQKTGIDKLIEAILLESEILDLKANFQRTAEGKILESKVDHGRGIVATVMVEKGTLAIGDSFVAGVWPGRVRAIFNDKGEKSQRQLLQCLLRFSVLKAFPTREIRSRLLMTKRKPASFLQRGRS